MKVMSAQELLEYLETIERAPTPEEIEQRLSVLSRSLYKATRQSFENQRSHRLVLMLTEITDQPEILAFHAIVGVAFSKYVKMKQSEDPETFSKELILACDRAIEHIARVAYDSCSKSSPQDSTPESS